MNFVPSSAIGTCHYGRLAAVDDNHEVDKDVDRKCMFSMNCHGANDTTEDDMLRKKANVSTKQSSHGGRCSNSSQWLKKSNASKWMESMEKSNVSRGMDYMLQLLCAFSKFLLKLAQLFHSSQMWISWVYLSRYPGECFPGDSFRNG